MLALAVQKAQANAEQQNRALRAAVNAEIRCRLGHDTLQSLLIVLANMLKQPRVK